MILNNLDADGGDHHAALLYLSPRSEGASRLLLCRKARSVEMQSEIDGADKYETGQCAWATKRCCCYADGPTASYGTHMFDMRCQENASNRLTKIKHPGAARSCWFQKSQ